MFKVRYSDVYKIELPKNHRFPELKYELLREQLLFDNTLSEADLLISEPISWDILTETHCKNYLNRIKALQLSPIEIRKIGFPQSESLVIRSRASVGGTLSSSIQALDYGLGLNLAGGTHHAFFDKGEGFCLFNDVAVSINYLLNRNLIKNALIIDLDVHQGNGTAQIFQNDRRVFTFSIHCKDNYPLKKEKSTLDIELPAYIKDSDYLNSLKKHIPFIIDNFLPNIVYYIAGVDVLETDKLGKMSLTRWGIAQRDNLILEELYKRQIPLVIVMGGGYSHNYNDIIMAHHHTYQTAWQLYN